MFEAVQPMNLTPLSDWLARSQGGHFVTKRLQSADLPLSETLISPVSIFNSPELVTVLIR